MKLNKGDVIHIRYNDKYIEGIFDDFSSSFNFMFVKINGDTIKVPIEYVEEVCNG